MEHVQSKYYFLIMCIVNYIYIYIEITKYSYLVIVHREKMAISFNL